MKKRLLSIILVTVILISAAGMWYYTSYPIIGVDNAVAISSEKFEDEFHSERISVLVAGNDFLPDSPVQKRKLEEVWEWNNSVSTELLEYSAEGGKAYNITVSGELKDGKTTLRYHGYIIKKNGTRIEYSEEKTFNFTLCSEERFFTGKL